MSSKHTETLVDGMGGLVSFSHTIKDWSKKSFWYRYKAIIVAKTATGFITQERLFRTHNYAMRWVVNKSKEYGASQGI